MLVRSTGADVETRTAGGGSGATRGLAIPTALP